MKYVLKTPDLGEGTTQAEIVEWRIKVGDFVREDQPIADLMTDKATVEVSSPVHGTIFALRGAPGDIMAVGSELVVFDVGGAETDEKTSAGALSPAPAPAGAKAVAPAVVATQAAPSTDNSATVRLAGAPAFATRTPGEKPVASPAVRRRAADLGVALAFVPGSGPGGRIVQEDLEAYLAGGGPVGRPGAIDASLDDGFVDIKVIGLRRKIAERMQDAKRRIPHIAYVEELDVTALEDLRARLNAQHGATRPKLSLLPFLMRAIVKAAAKYPEVNAHYDDAAGIVRRFRAVHIGVATQTPVGLVVPVARHAERRDLWQCAQEIARLAAAARSGNATRDELTGSTITISSLGALGGIVSTPVINSPEVAIVGVNKIVERPVVAHGQIVVRKMMNLSSSFDHRIIDGWNAASFIQEIKSCLEQPALLFMEDPR
jgi:2-oxoisovalerate dehydrogenase E2 component (dihydrolipoyl transacylase)